MQKNRSLTKRIINCGRNSKTEFLAINYLRTGGQFPTEMSATNHTRTVVAHLRKPNGNKPISNIRTSKKTD